MQAWRPIVLLVLETGCAHSTLPTDGTFQKGGLSVQVGPVPVAWTPIQLSGADIAYRDEPAAGTAMLGVHCGRNLDAPLTILTEHLIMGTTDRDFVAQDVVPFDDREALHTVLRAKLDGVLMEYDLYVTKKDGCVTDLVYVAPPQGFAAGAPDFERFATGLRARWAAPIGTMASTP